MVHYLCTVLSEHALMLPATAAFSPATVAPLMTREAFAACVGLPVTVLVAQAERGYWPQITIGKRVFINVEAVRAKALEHAQQFTF